MNIKTRRGSIVVEAAIFLPIFLIALLTLAHLIRVVQVQETLMNTLVAESRKLAVEEYVSEYGELPPGKFGDIWSKVMASELKKGLCFYEQSRSGMKQELGNWMKDFRITEFEVGQTANARDNLCTIAARGRINLPMAELFHRKIEVQERIVCRGFVGTDSPVHPFSFERMEREEGSGAVYVFPRAGERYHGEGCRTIRRMPRRGLLSASMKKNKDSCRLCRSGKLPVGTPVLCFDSGTYHRVTCSTVNRYIVCMEEEEAAEEGYTPCKICGGD